MASFVRCSLRRFSLLILLPCLACTPEGTSDADASDDDDADSTHDPGDDACLTVPGTGPWTRHMVEWRSDDGTSFTEHRVFQNCADVPSLARNDDGMVVAAFQAFQDQSEDDLWDKIGVRISEDAGESWSEVAMANLIDFPPDSARPFDPTVVWDASSEQWRMYYSLSLDDSTKLDDEICTYSASSPDGIDFTFEPDARFCADDRPVIDPAVAELDGAWYYSAPAGPPQAGAFFATSHDGLAFNRQTDIASDMNHRYTGNFVGTDGSLYFYAAETNFPEGNHLFWNSTSDGGATWAGPTQTNIPAGKDPAALRLADGTWVLLVPTL